MIASEPTDEQRSSRIRLYAAYTMMEHAIADMPVDQSIRSELTILHTAAFRMALMHNDGHLSPRVLLPW